MQLRYSYIVFLFVVFASCKNDINSEEVIKVMGAIYNSFPKVIPPPPNVRDVNPEIRNPDEFLKRKYAIFQEYINLNPSRGSVANVFYEKGSDELFKEVQIDSALFTLVKQIPVVKNDKYINKKKLNDYLKKDYKL